MGFSTTTTLESVTSTSHATMESLTSCHASPGTKVTFACSSIPSKHWKHFIYSLEIIRQVFMVLKIYSYPGTPLILTMILIWFSSPAWFLTTRLELAPVPRTEMWLGAPKSARTPSLNWRWLMASSAPDTPSLDLKGLSRLTQSCPTRQAAGKNLRL